MKSGRKASRSQAPSIMRGSARSAWNSWSATAPTSSSSTGWPAASTKPRPCCASAANSAPQAGLVHQHHHGHLAFAVLVVVRRLDVASGGRHGFRRARLPREQWITYRDQETYRNVVKAAPLYPLNSLMTQGFVHAKAGPAAALGNDPREIRREMRSFFASGTCLQELYVSPEKLTPENWDDLAACASWAAKNADVLVDTHWIGGDPGKGEVYGWASWSPRQGILALRNPTARRASITIDLGRAFELPPERAAGLPLAKPLERRRPAERAASLRQAARLRTGAVCGAGL